jgi:ferredoxin
MEEYLHDTSGGGQAAEFFGSRTPLTRALPYEEQIPVSSVATSYESAREIIRAADFGAIGLCYCRHKKEHLGQSCSKGAPQEGICISLGTAARFLVRRGFAQEQSREELLEVLGRARDLHLTHITDNIRHKPSFICNCCSCCCELLAGVQAGFTGGVAKAAYCAAIDPGRCSGCGVCFAACNVRALGPVHGPAAPSLARGAVVHAESCLGCGACIAACPAGALRLVARRQKSAPPQTRKALYRRILWEKGRWAPYLISGLKRRVWGWYAREKQR